MQSVVVEAEKYSLTTGKGSYTLLGWWRFCYLHTFETKQHTIYWNDKVFSGTSEGPEMVRGGGLLVIGQDQDRMGGGYTFSQSLNAVVADLRLYNRTLTNSEALDFVSCKETHLDPQPLRHGVFHKQLPCVTMSGEAYQFPSPPERTNKY
ncbi:hypothetical protein Pcinc_010369 [Petrolisthes cinctipes]|uniref:Pentraxin (PTX) domain-containing protein n=2 Tax=Petrolisthes cinctipes TaxID=88211 RepID=A0AAE1G4Z3_PETCI|nr:hypothetical protein Pcinc_010369 [Petrolisthes cinctipes]